MAPPSSPDDEGQRLRRCIRDLAALNALPSMCVGRSPDEALEMVLDALPTALSAELVHLKVPGSPPKERTSVDGAALAEDGVAGVSSALSGAGDDEGVLDVPGRGTFSFLAAELRVGAERGRLVVGRRTGFDAETDRVLVRVAANLVGTTLETAHVLDLAQRKDDFLAMLGHELRNPLAPILTAVELLVRKPAADRERQVIERHTRHLARLVDDLLDISRVTRGHVELRKENVSLASVLERATEIASPLMVRQHHLVRVDDAGDVTVRGDPVRLAQVFGNLLTNAAKFTPAGGTVEVSVVRAPGRVRVTVRDTGRGISRDQLRRIFEPFVQVDRERDSLRGGLGLGLAIVRDLVERHEGTIDARSDGLGRGSTFTVELPRIAASTTSPIVAVRGAPPSRAGMRVLVVDDNCDVADLLSEALQIEGFHTAVENDGRAALERWRSFRPHAAVLDVGLPDFDGLDLAKALRAEHGTDALLIAATGYGEERDRKQAAQAGFDRHFVKPVSVQDLVVALDERLQGMRLEGS